LLCGFARVERTLLSAAFDFELDANREKPNSPTAKQSFEKARLQVAPPKWNLPSPAEGTTLRQGTSFI
jgi:hypothetical protein